MSPYNKPFLRAPRIPHSTEELPGAPGSLEGDQDLGFTPGSLLRPGQTRSHSKSPNLSEPPPAGVEAPRRPHFVPQTLTGTSRCPTNISE